MLSTYVRPVPFCHHGPPRLDSTLIGYGCKAQCEMKRLGVSPEQPLAVQQWQSAWIMGCFCRST